MKGAAFAMADEGRLSGAHSLARLGQLPFLHDGVLDHLPGPLAGWSAVRDLVPLPAESFRDWWAKREKTPGGRKAGEA
jgi:L-lactate dehydrogenase complex protein LldF